MKKYLIASLILAATTVPSLAAAQHFVVEDTEKYFSVIDAAPSKDLKVLGQRQGYGSRAQAETTLKGRCRANALKLHPSPSRGGMKSYGLAFALGVGFGLSRVVSSSSGRCN
jgi:hypothetical protein